MAGLVLAIVGFTSGVALSTYRSAESNSDALFGTETSTGALEQFDRIEDKIDQQGEKLDEQSTRIDRTEALAEYIADEANGKRIRREAAGDLVFDDIDDHETGGDDEE
ncbi:hypothetical protein DVK00_02810 [Haloarcula sp. Atlit-47R]|uniref:hypothetical protein n=1 Tax=Haloarcula sp. Atlit-47R TaxID=2282132 RepID=UPI000EF275AF|nr:hypothetical protein [Haloarcula sp. Atlit-47R]RLM47455.1 hypothetical protein DVK00_02810 [Haloarcula sp. Atlit-47R]